MNSDTNNSENFTPGDEGLIKDVITRLKSQGTFDQFRKECIADVDTKPAHQNLRHRVGAHINAYLSSVKWSPNLSKNQMREYIRKYLTESSFLDQGVQRVVEQVVNPKIHTTLVPKVEDLVYRMVRSDDNSDGTNTSTHFNNYEQMSNSDIEYNIDIVQAEDKLTDFTQPITDNTATFAAGNVPDNADIDETDDEISPPFEPHIFSDDDSSGSDYSQTTKMKKLELHDRSDDDEPNDHHHHHRPRIIMSSGGSNRVVMKDEPKNDDTDDLKMTTKKETYRKEDDDSLKSNKKTNKHKHDNNNKKKEKYEKDKYYGDKNKDKKSSSENKMALDASSTAATSATSKGENKSHSSNVRRKRKHRRNSIERDKHGHHRAATSNKRKSSADERSNDNIEYNETVVCSPKTGGGGGGKYKYSQENEFVEKSPPDNNDDQKSMMTTMSKRKSESTHRDKKNKRKKESTKDNCKSDTNKFDGKSSDRDDSDGGSPSASRRRSDHRMTREQPTTTSGNSETKGGGSSSSTGGNNYDNKQRKNRFDDIDTAKFDYRHESIDADDGEMMVTDFIQENSELTNENDVVMVTTSKSRKVIELRDRKFRILLNTVDVSNILTSSDDDNCNERQSDEMITSSSNVNYQSSSDGDKYDRLPDNNDDNNNNNNEKVDDVYLKQLEIRRTSSVVRLPTDELNVTEELIRINAEKMSSKSDFNCNSLRDADSIINNQGDVDIGTSVDKRHKNKATNDNHISSVVLRCESPNQMETRNFSDINESTKSSREKFVIGNQLISSNCIAIRRLVNKRKRGGSRSAELFKLCSKAANVRPISCEINNNSKFPDDDDHIEEKRRDLLHNSYRLKTPQIRIPRIDFLNVEQRQDNHHHYSNGNIVVDIIKAPSTASDDEKLSSNQLSVAENKENIVVIHDKTVFELNFCPENDNNVVVTTNCISSAAKNTESLIENKADVNKSDRQFKTIILPSSSDCRDFEQQDKNNNNKVKPIGGKKTSENSETFTDPSDKLLISEEIDNKTSALNFYPENNDGAAANCIVDDRSEKETKGTRVIMKHEGDVEKLSVPNFGIISKPINCRRDFEYRDENNGDGRCKNIGSGKTYAHNEKFAKNDSSQKSSAAENEQITTIIDNKKDVVKLNSRQFANNDVFSADSSAVVDTESTLTETIEDKTDDEVRKKLFCKEKIETSNSEGKVPISTIYKEVDVINNSRINLNSKLTHAVDENDTNIILNSGDYDGQMSDFRRSADTILKERNTVVEKKSIADNIDAELNKDDVILIPVSDDNLTDRYGKPPRCYAKTINTNKRNEFVNSRDFNDVESKDDVSFSSSIGDTFVVNVGGSLLTDGLDRICTTTTINKTSCDFLVNNAYNVGNICKNIQSSSGCSLISGTKNALIDGAAISNQNPMILKKYDDNKEATSIAASSYYDVNECGKISSANRSIIERSGSRTYERLKHQIGVNDADYQLVFCTNNDDSDDVLQSLIDSFSDRCKNDGTTIITAAKTNKNVAEKSNSINESRDRCDNNNNQKKKVGNCRIDNLILCTDDDSSDDFIESIIDSFKNDHPRSEQITQMKTNQNNSKQSVVIGNSDNINTNNVIDNNYEAGKALFPSNDKNVNNAIEIITHALKNDPVEIIQTNGNDDWKQSNSVIKSSGISSNIIGNYRVDTDDGSFNNAIENFVDALGDNYTKMTETNGNNLKNDSEKITQIETNTNNLKNDSEKIMQMETNGNNLENDSKKIMQMETNGNNLKNDPEKIMKIETNANNLKNDSEKIMQIETDANNLENDPEKITKMETNANNLKNDSEKITQIETNANNLKNDPEKITKMEINENELKQSSVVGSTIMNSYQNGKTNFCTSDNDSDSFILSLTESFKNNEEQITEIETNINNQTQINNSCRSGGDDNISVDNYEPYSVTTNTLILSEILNENSNERMKVEFSENDSEQSNLTIKSRNNKSTNYKSNLLYSGSKENFDDAVISSEIKVEKTNQCKTGVTVNNSNPVNDQPFLEVAEKLKVEKLTSLDDLGCSEQKSDGTGICYFSSNNSGSEEIITPKNEFGEDSKKFFKTDEIPNSKICHPVYNQANIGVRNEVCVGKNDENILPADISSSTEDAADLKLFFGFQNIKQLVERNRKFIGELLKIVKSSPSTSVHNYEPFQNCADNEDFKLFLGFENVQQPVPFNVNFVSALFKIIETESKSCTSQKCGQFKSSANNEECESFVGFKNAQRMVQYNRNFIEKLLKIIKPAGSSNLITRGCIYRRSFRSSFAAKNEDLESFSGFKNEQQVLRSNHKFINELLKLIPSEPCLGRGQTSTDNEDDDVFVGFDVLPKIPQVELESSITCMQEGAEIDQQNLILNERSGAGQLPPTSSSHVSGEVPFEGFGNYRKYVQNSKFVYYAYIKEIVAANEQINNFNSKQTVNQGTIRDLKCNSSDQQVTSSTNNEDQIPLSISENVEKMEEQSVLVDSGYQQDVKINIDRNNRDQRSDEHNTNEKKDCKDFCVCEQDTNNNPVNIDGMDLPLIRDIVNRKRKYYMLPLDDDDLNLPYSMFQKQLSKVKKTILPASKNISND